MLPLFLLAVQFSHQIETADAGQWTPSMARVVTCCWNHATEPVLASSSHDDIWPQPEPAAISKEGIPPSPAILNMQGWRSVAGVLGLWHEDDQQQSPVPAVAEKDPTDLSPVTPEIAELLAGWEKASLVKEARGYKFDRTTYDLTRNVETRSSGYLIYRSDSEGRFSCRDSSEPKAKSERKDSRGNSFSIEPASTECWIWNQIELLHINRSDNTYSVAPLPRELGTKPGAQFRKWLMELAPFAIDIDQEVIRREWSFEIRNRNDSIVLLTATPRVASRKQQFHQCLILIDPRSYRVSAIKYVDAAQKFETVYRLRGMSQSTDEPIEGGFDPERNLKGLRLVPMKFGK